MKAQVITTEYTGQFPVQPWQRVVETASQSAVIEVAPEPAPAGDAPRKASDRGASAVEWVIITGIVVAIVAGVGVIISKAITSKANDACNKISAAGTGDAGGGNAGTTAGTGTNTGCK
jgi:Flp pilus assembly pilin Flp